MKIGSKELIRDINTRLVIEAIMEKAPLSRADLSKMLGLTKATISSIIQQLLEKNLVEEIGSGETSIGRKPTLLRLYSQAGISASIDLGLANLHILFTDLSGAALYKADAAVAEGPLMEQLFKLLDTGLTQVPPTPYGIIGITLGIHGVVKDNSIIFTPYYDVSSYNFAQEISQRYCAPVHLMNSSNLAVLGENTFCTKVENVAFIGVHTGIGMGMILNNQLYTGFNGYAGEFGHTIIELEGRPCPCGNFGCLEQYTSERSLLMDLAHLKNTDKITFCQFAALYREKDADAVAIAEQFVRYISAGINNILNLYNPESIVINSRFTAYFPDLLESIKKRLICKTNFAREIYLSRLNNDAILYGAVTINVIDFLQIDHFKTPLCL